MDTEFSHEDLLHVLRSAGVGMASVETPRVSVNGSALKKGTRIHVTVYTLEGPTVKGERRCRRVVDRWADSPEEAARVLRQSVVRHARIREVLHEAQRRIYTDQSISN